MTSEFLTTGFLSPVFYQQNERPRRGMKFFDLTIWRWHRAIIADAEKKLGRRLKDYEKVFITSRGGCIALEMIHDTVRAAAPEELERYLASERQQKQ
jgi:hypothetical protein